ncbi:carbon-nitrogen hydrolase family protein [Mumia zhuanghuii]|uniref:Carbon-nitrogen hydrolase family protein n=1 Tax=Mumia zhuanghuii TaxID=2585211 RepID=A0A5C4MPZ7_9ACTN|nr:carbon-nitrogen hydrolase family protein [Mumia zhuanghuii]TNC33216.1 carbon-nitrogen hydrolase family protein [Mumia zhuanghuii]TNC45352.1 carbon-nitrogen hydrolase family protein [Mumia zhuanghuii]
MTVVRVAAVQLAATEDVAANLASAVRLVEEAVAQGAQLVVLPEFGNHVSWYADRDHARRMAQTLDGDFVRTLASTAAEHRLHLLVNCTLSREDGRTTGSNILIGPDGAILATSDKQVLMGSERDHLDPATEASPVVDTELGRLGLYSCMDGVINETPRMLAVDGAQVLLNSLNSFALDEASLHVPVRAVENRVWVIAANKVGPLVPEHSIEAVATAVGVPVERLHGAGESQIVAPDGTVVARGPLSGEAVVVADIDVSLADDKRRPDGTDVLAVRRPELYGPIVAPPHGRRAPAGAPEVVAAVVCPGEGDDVLALVRDAVAGGAQLVVLPELAAWSGGVAGEGSTPSFATDALRDALAGSSATAVTSVREDDQHVGLAVDAGGVVLRQPQLHASVRHAAWATRLGDALEVVDLPWGRLAVVVGDDALHPETFRLASLQDADVVAVPFTTAAAHDLDLLLLERSAENRLNVVVASRPGPHGAGMLVPLSADFTLWSGGWQFAGVISRPRPVLADGPLTMATLSPEQASNRLVSRGTDVVDGRPWALAETLVRPSELSDASI